MVILVVGVLESFIVIVFGTTVVESFDETSLSFALVRLTCVVPSFFALNVIVSTCVFEVIPFDNVVSKPAIM